MKFKRTKIQCVKFELDSRVADLEDWLMDDAELCFIHSSEDESIFTITVPKADANRVAAWLKERGAEEVGNAQ